MKSKSQSSRVSDRYGMIEALEPRIAPAAVLNDYLPASPKFVTVTAGGSLLVTAGEVLTTGSGGGGIYLLYVQTGQVLVHTTDLNGNGQIDFNEITGLSVGNGARIVSFVDIHGSVVTDLNPDGTLSDGGKGDILLDANITEIDMRSLTTNDFVATATESQAQLVQSHLAMSSYSIYGNVYAGGGLGVATDTFSGLLINTAGSALQAAKYPLVTGDNYYQYTEPVVGSIYVGTSASGQSFNFGLSGQGVSASLNALPVDTVGNLLAFNPAPGEAGASIYNIASAGAGENFSIGTIHAGNGGFNAPGGSIVNVALQGDNAGTYQLIAGNAGNGTTGQNGGSIVNFSETGAIISEVVLQSGNGGTGLIGVGGSAGQITFNPSVPIAINAHLVMEFGSGGDGYSGGGAGGGTPGGNFVTPSGQLTTPENLVTTWHPMGSIGTTQSIDFNNDGLSDAVFSTANPNQVVVAFGNYSAAVQQFGLNSDTYIYLNSPAQVESIVVGNFTGTDIPHTNKPELDIAVASGTGSFAGVEVYLSEYNPKTGAFEGFSDPLFSPLPSLTPYGYEYTSTAITKLVAGDFSGTGVMGLAVLVQETIPNLGTVDSVLMFLNGETTAAQPGGTGFFYNLPGNFVDLGSNANFNPTKSIFEPTALTAYKPAGPGQPSNGHDVVIEAGYGAQSFNIIDDSLAVLGLPPQITQGGAFGLVDTNRNVNTGTQNNTSSTQFTVQGIAVTQDVLNPNVADVIALSLAPTAFLDIFQGSGSAGGPGGGGAAPAFTLGSIAGNNVDQAGVSFGVQGSNPVAIVAVPNMASTSTNAIYSDVAILDYSTAGGNPDLIYVLNVSETTAAGAPANATPTEAAGATATAAVSPTEQWVTITPGFGRNNNEVAFGEYIPMPTANPSIPGTGLNQFGFITANPLTSFPDYQGLAISQPTILNAVSTTAANEALGAYSLAPSKVAGYFLTGGNGGNSQSGAGGAGGSFGDTLTVTGSGATLAATGSLSIEFPGDATYEGLVRLVGGNGGNGFTNGGAGGNLNGISVTYNDAATFSGTALLLAGNGGESLTATGGAGGSLSKLYVLSGELFVAGNGGIGVVGGAGGNLLGNTTPGLITGGTNNVNPVIVLKGGDGANGITGGGNGGGINSFVNQFNATLGGTEGLLNYTGGKAGNAVDGQAGTGGSIVNSSPYSQDNNLVGDIYLQGGAGGSGKRGGGGGSVVGFNQVSTIQSVPTSSTIIGGAGGNATIGAGGTGGGISDVEVAANGNGLLYTFNFSNPTILDDVLDAVTSIVPITYNRTVAGPGGTSAGGAGGVGGGISSINTTSTAATAQNVVAAGAGGAGLTAGGAGGDISSIIVDAGSVTGEGKVVVIAGDGGTSSSGKPLPGANPVTSIGGVDGPGGAGGNINGVTQPTNTNTDVDLIAGNGGATINHGVAYGNATTDNSGVGGSISNVSVAGSIGNIDPLVAIQSYNNIFTGVTSNGIVTGTTMQDFVDNYILGTPSAPMDDSVGNVGLVAGAAGFVEGSQTGTMVPSTDGINGSVTNIHAENIMSMVAGNVDKIALIQSLTNYGVTITDGVLGANKIAYYNPVAGVIQDIGVLGQLNYINPDGSVGMTPLPGGGELIDGAFVAMNIRHIESPRDFQGTES